MPRFICDKTKQSSRLLKQLFFTECTWWRVNAQRKRMFQISIISIRSSKNVFPYAPVAMLAKYLADKCAQSRPVSYGISAIQIRTSPSVCMLYHKSTLLAESKIKRFESLGRLESCYQAMITEIVKQLLLCKTTLWIHPSMKTNPLAYILM